MKGPTQPACSRPGQCQVGGGLEAQLRSPAISFQAVAFLPRARQRCGQTCLSRRVPILGPEAWSPHDTCPLACQHVDALSGGPRAGSLRRGAAGGAGTAHTGPWVQVGAARRAGQHLVTALSDTWACRALASQQALGTSLDLRTGTPSTEMFAHPPQAPQPKSGQWGSVPRLSQGSGLSGGLRGAHALKALSWASGEVGQGRLCRLADPSGGQWGAGGETREEDPPAAAQAGLTGGKAGRVRQALRDLPAPAAREAQGEEGGRGPWSQLWVWDGGHRTPRKTQTRACLLCPTRPGVSCRRLPSLPGACQPSDLMTMPAVRSRRTSPVGSGCWLGCQGALPGHPHITLCPSGYIPDRPTRGG